MIAVRGRRTIDTTVDSLLAHPRWPHSGIGGHQVRHSRSCEHPRAAIDIEAMTSVRWVGRQTTQKGWRFGAKGARRRSQDDECVDVQLHE